MKKNLLYNNYSESKHNHKITRVTVSTDVCSVCFMFYSDLERSVDEMKAGAGLNHHLVTEQEIEQKSLELRRLGETVAELKSE